MRVYTPYCSTPRSARQVLTVRKPLENVEGGSTMQAQRPGARAPYPYPARDITDQRTLNLFRARLRAAGYDVDDIDGYALTRLYRAALLAARGGDIVRGLEIVVGGVA